MQQENATFGAPRPRRQPPLRAARLKLAPRKSFGIARKVRRYRDNGGNLPNQSKFAQKPGPKVVQDCP